MNIGQLLFSGAAMFGIGKYVVPSITRWMGVGAKGIMSTYPQIAGKIGGVGWIPGVGALTTGAKLLTGKLKATAPWKHLRTWDKAEGVLKSQIDDFTKLVAGGAKGSGIYDDTYRTLKNNLGGNNKATFTSFLESNSSLRGIADKSIFRAAEKRFGAVNQAASQAMESKKLFGNALASNAAAIGLPTMASSVMGYSIIKAARRRADERIGGTINTF